MAPPSSYPNPPVVLVLLEVRHPETAPLDVAMFEALKSHVAEFTPIPRREQVVEMELPSGKQVSTSVSKLVSRDLHTNVTFQPRAITVEVTRYDSWNWFLGVAECALKARQDVAPVDGVERVGLRYINEIRPDTGSDGADWSDWVSVSLLGPKDEVESLGLVHDHHQGVMQSRGHAPGDTLTLRFGAGVGQVVVSTPSLKRLKEPQPNNPYFVLDTDGAWTAPSGTIPEFDVADIVQICERLHQAIKGTFEALITDKLRSEVLNRAE